MCLRENLYSPVKSRAIMYVVAPIKRTTEQHQLHWTRSAAVVDHLQARPATENSRNAVCPLVVELAPLSAALPVVLFGEPQYLRISSSVDSTRT